MSIVGAPLAASDKLQGDNHSTQLAKVGVMLLFSFRVLRTFDRNMSIKYRYNHSVVTAYGCNHSVVTVGYI